MGTVFLCIGGPLDKQKGTWKELRERPEFEDYIAFNCAHSLNRNQWNIRRMKRMGQAIPPTAVYIHRNIFEGMF
jgi:hypothetical protein